MQLFVPYVLVSTAVFGTTALGQYSTADTDNGMGEYPSSTPAYMPQPTPAGMMPSYMGGGAQVPPMNVVNVGGGNQGQMPGSPVQSLLSRLVSFFDFSHVSSTPTDTPVTFSTVYDPATSKFTHLTADIVQNGDAYYIPVCPVDVVTGVASAQGCEYGISLNPVPLNVAQAHLSIIRTLFSIIRNIARPTFMFGESNAMNSA
ncbi:hypothetical protein EV175_002134 [Coemansia sp. RSA 1933]|nr:hypothetical protein EV175_002134 [Coemansia sp. RSA 1933]